MRALEFSTDEFFAGIRELYNRRSRDPELERLTFCLLGVASPSDLISDTLTTPFNIGRRIDLTDFSEEEAAPLAQGFRRSEREGQALLRRVLYWTGGHPYLTQRLCQAIAEKPSVEDDSGVDRICEELFMSRRARDRDDNLILVRERMLRSEADLASLLGLYEAVWRGKRVRDDETNPLVGILLLSGIARVRSGWLAVRNRIYERVFDRTWVKINMPDAELRRQRAAYRRGVWRTAAVAATLVLMVLMVAALSVREEWEGALLSDGHKGGVRNAIFSPDGRRVVSVGEDAKVIVWDFERRERIATFDSDHTSWVTCVAFSPDGKMFATGSRDRTIIIWDAEGLKKIKVLHGHKVTVSSVAFSPDGRLLASSAGELRAPEDQTIIWEVGKWEIIRELPLGITLGNLFFSPNDGRWLLMSHKRKAWDTVTQQIVPIMSNGNWLAISPDATRIAGMGGQVCFWDLPRRGDPTLQEFIKCEQAHKDHGRGVAFSPAGRSFASAAEDIVLWNADTLEMITRLEHSAIPRSLDFHPNGQWLISGHADGSILLWDVVARKRTANFNEHSAPVYTVAFSSDGKRTASAGGDGSIIIWDAEHHSKEAMLIEHRSQVRGVAFSSDNRLLASADQDGELILWDVAQRAYRWKYKSPLYPDYCLAFSPDGKWIATTHGLHETTEGRQVIDFQNGPPISSAAYIYGLAFSSDGKRLVWVTELGQIVLWDAEKWQVIDQQKMSNTQLISVSFSPDGKWLVTGEDEGAVRLWSVEPLREVAVVGRHASRIKSVAFSPDNRQVASAGDDRTIKLWDVNGRRLVQEIGAHTAPVLAIAFSPDGQLVSGENDKSIWLYQRHRSLWGYRWD